MRHRMIAIQGLVVHSNMREMIESTRLGGAADYQLAWRAWFKGKGETEQQTSREETTHTFLGHQFHQVGERLQSGTAENDGQVCSHGVVVRHLTDLVLVVGNAGTSPHQTTTQPYICCEGFTGGRMHQGSVQLAEAVRVLIIERTLETTGRGRRTSQSRPVKAEVSVVWYVTSLLR